MRFTIRMPRMTVLLIAVLAIPLGCDWVPGTTFSSSQTLRTWTPLASGNCLMIGSYIFARNTDMPPFQGKSSIKMETDSKDDQEFLPPLFDINYRLNGTPYFQQAYELKKGKGSLREIQPDFWAFEADDRIDYEICAGGGGTIPTFTKISVRFEYKFDKLGFN